MTRSQPNYDEQLAAEIRMIPKECLPALINVVHAFREGVTVLPSAEDGFVQGWKDIKQDQTHPIDTLWDDIDAQ